MMNNQDNLPDTSVSAGSLEGARRATTPVTTTQIPNPEVEAKAVRRRFSAKYKRSVLEQADRCTNLGDIGALLRREGLYSSHLSNWRRQCEKGALGGLAPRKRGRKPDPASAEKRVIAQLSKENEHLRGQLKKAQTIIEVQKKLSEILEIPMDDPGKEKNS